LFTAIPSLSVFRQNTEKVSSCSRVTGRFLLRVHYVVWEKWNNGATRWRRKVTIRTVILTVHSTSI